MVSSPTNPSLPTDGVLLVEGQDDKHIVWHLCAKNNSTFSVRRNEYDHFVTLLAQSTTFHIAEQGNRPRVISAMGQLVKARNPKPFGIVVDADDDQGHCWSQIVAGFNGTGVKLPCSPDPTGTIIPGEGFLPRIGIWLMPNNVSTGEMENFIRGMVSTSDLIWPLSEGYINGIPDQEKRFASNKLEKATIFAWLSTKKEPGRIGAAIGDNQLEVDGRQCREFLDWIERLFG